uniref:Ig-like domain-containing protein n=1 Tax=Amphiprion ocellaris TaxID=80972 RepID=A0A3Q1B4E4_AMPOC
MCGGHRHLTWTLMLLSLAGKYSTCVLCNMWKVEYQQQHICAVKGSSVAVLCSFHRPDSQTVEKVMWGHVKAPDSKGRLIVDSNSRKVSKRFQYTGDKHDNCSLKINQVEHKYAGIYTVRIIYNKKDSLPGYKPSPRLKVVGNISMAKTKGKEAVKEGDSVNVTCINSCDGGNISSVFTWFKDGESINEGPVLYLTNISSANSGNYTCSLKAHRGTTSRVLLSVRGPKNTSVFIRPSVEGDDSSSLILTCSSHANPPVENYTWFKTVGDDILDVGHQSVLFPGDGGCYFCCATNKHGSQNSSAVTLNIKRKTLFKKKKRKNSLILQFINILIIIQHFLVFLKYTNKELILGNTSQSHTCNWWCCCASDCDHRYCC